MGECKEVWGRCGKVCWGVGIGEGRGMEGVGKVREDGGV